MEFIIEGRKLSSSEIMEFVTNYKKEILQPKSRYYHINKLIPTQSYGLDYGCGWGAFTQILREKGNDVIGQDLSNNEIEICKHVWGDGIVRGNEHWTTSSIKEFDDHQFDFVNSNQVIEHTHNPGNYLHQINRVLKPGGTLVISLPNIMNPRYFAPLFAYREKTLSERLHKLNQSILQDYRKNSDHIQGWDPYHFVRLVSTVGFVMEEFVPLEGIPMPFFLKRFGIPPYIHIRSRLKNYCYTMAFRFKKERESTISEND
jgi:SAM-dependent methyltransferase